MNAGLLAASVAALSLFVGGCVVAPAAPRYVETVRVAPPPPYIEYIGQPPYVGYVWISGYWNWGGVRYVWVPGRWEKPRHGQRWVPHRWERNGDRWRQQGGHWERDARRAPERNDRWQHDVAPRREVQVAPQVEQRRDETHVEPRRSERESSRDADDDRGRPRERGGRGERLRRGEDRQGERSGRE